jgi:hypothetical protein
MKVRQPTGLKEKNEKPRIKKPPLTTARGGPFKENSNPDSRDQIPYKSVDGHETSDTI